eukprot:5237674-Alexandrium_andersonii.AAC.1
MVATRGSTWSSAATSFSEVIGNFRRTRPYAGPAQSSLSSSRSPLSASESSRSRASFSRAGMIGAAHRAPAPARWRLWTCAMMTEGGG